MVSTSDSPLLINMLASIQQIQTPLNSLYFSEFNLNLVQGAIQRKVKQTTKYSIDRQNDSDLLAIMRSAFINNAGDPYKSVCEQVRNINAVVIDIAVSQVYTGISQYIDYSKDIAMDLQPMANPINTSTYGNKLGLNDKIGI